MLGEQIRESLHNGQLTYGTHVCGLGNAVSASILATAPLDFAFICTEHMPLDRSEQSIMCKFYSGRGISPIVRIPYPSAHHATMALDAGADGIVAPYVETVEQVREIVGAVRYRPIKGEMLRQFMTGVRKPTRKTREFLGRFNRHTYAIIGIESVAAYKNLDALIHEEGVDGVFVGPHDMTVSLEAPEEYDNPEFLRVIEDIILRCRAAHVGIGVHFSTAFPIETVQRFIGLGMNWVLDGADVALARMSLVERRELLCGKQAARSSAAQADISSCLVASQPRK